MIPFQSILVDALSVRPSDFVRAAMCFGDANNNNEVCLLVLQDVLDSYFASFG